jgi:hypothetical protein
MPSPAEAGNRIATWLSWDGGLPFEDVVQRDLLTFVGKLLEAL